MRYTETHKHPISLSHSVTHTHPITLSHSVTHTHSGSHEGLATASVHQLLAESWLLWRLLGTGIRHRQVVSQRSVSGPTQLYGPVCVCECIRVYVCVCVCMGIINRLHVDDAPIQNICDHMMALFIFKKRERCAVFFIGV